MTTKSIDVIRAERLARMAHEGQTDKAGAPYIEHVERVARTVSGNDLAEAVAWLHDVLEDCPAHVEEFWQFPAEITRAVSLLTRIPGQHYLNYYSRIKADPVALAVKLADIADNADERRLAKLDWKVAARLRRKYKKARSCLS